MLNIVQKMAGAVYQLKPNGLLFRLAQLTLASDLGAGSMALLSCKILIHHKYSC